MRLQYYANSSGMYKSTCGKINATDYECDCEGNPLEEKSEIKMSTCGTCGYTWKTGTNGSHSCSENMQKTINKLQKELEQFKNEKNWTRSYNYKGELINESALFIPRLLNGNIGKFNN